MLRIIPAVLIVAAVASGCSGLKNSQRQPVKGAESPMISSTFAPDAAENCSELKKIKCPYFNNPFKTPRDVCVERVTAEANTVKANYIYVDEPGTSIGGFETSSPIATLYNCSNLTIK